MYPRKRRVDTRSEKRLFVVSVEGAVTEVEYLKRLEKLYYGTCMIDILSDVNKSSPGSVLDKKLHVWYESNLQEVEKELG